MSGRKIYSAVTTCFCSAVLLLCLTSLARAQSNGVLRQYWSGISGTSVSNLTSNSNYPNNPNSSGTLSIFEGQTNTADNYGCRYRGFIIPSTTGSYTFFIASDDNSELRLSTTSDPNDAQLIASVNGYCSSRQWNKYSSQQSSSIPLQAGQYYYIEALHKDGTQNDNLAVGWQGPGISGDAERPIPNSRLRVWTGTQYTLSLTNDGHGITDPASSATVTAGVARTITATPATGYKFSNWTVTNGNAILANNNSISTAVTLWNGNATVRANFTPNTYTLSVTNDGNGSTIPSGDVTVTHGVAQSIEATAKSGYTFLTWTVQNGTASITNPTSPKSNVTLTGGNATVLANFIPVKFNLTITNNGYGSTDPTGTLSVSPNQQIPIAATPSGSFINWSTTSGTATFTNPNSATTTVSLSGGDATIRANFTVPTLVLTITNDGYGTTSPTGNVSVTPGVAQSISATPLSGYNFTNWTVTSGSAVIDNPNSSSAKITLSNGNATVRANFNLIHYIATFTNDGNGTTEPDGAITIGHGVEQTVSATPHTGFRFYTWSVEAGSATVNEPINPTTKIKLQSGNATIQANFIAIEYQLTVSNDGHGSTTPSGIVTVLYGVQKQIIAKPSSGYVFVNWTVTEGTASVSDPSNDTAFVSLTLENATVRANFTSNFSNLTFTNDGHGTTTPAGTIAIPRNTPYEITALSGAGYVFSGWSITSGAASIANPGSNVTFITLSNADATVKASFTTAPPVVPANRRIAITGVLYDANSTPVGAVNPVTIAVKVSITLSAEGGTPLYTETFMPENNNGVTVENGHFVVTLGTGTYTGNLSTVLQANPTCFAEITILDDTPDVLLPRTPITAAAYSLGGTSSLTAGNILHGSVYPNNPEINAVIGTYYVNDNDKTTWLRVESGWKQID